MAPDHGHPPNPFSRNFEPTDGHKNKPTPRRSARRPSSAVPSTPAPTVDTAPGPPRRGKKGRSEPAAAAVAAAAAPDHEQPNSPAVNPFAKPTPTVSSPTRSPVRDDTPREARDQQGAKPDKKQKRDKRRQKGEEPQRQRPLDSPTGDEIAPDADPGSPASARSSRSFDDPEPGQAAEPVIRPRGNKRGRPEDEEAHVPPDGSRKSRNERRVKKEGQPDGAGEAEPERVGGGGTGHKNDNGSGRRDSKPDDIEHLYQEAKRRAPTTLINQDLYDELSEKIAVLETEKAQLMIRLKYAQNEILQRNTENEKNLVAAIGTAYEELVGGIKVFVGQFMGPFHRAGRDRALVAARSYGTSSLTKSLDQIMVIVSTYGDIGHAVRHANTDDEVVFAIIMRYLYAKILTQDLYNCAGREAGTVQDIETSLRENVVPERLLVSIRTWRSEAYAGMFAASAYGQFRDLVGRQLTAELGSLLELYCPEGEREQFDQGLSQMCVCPAMLLYEKMQTSIHSFTFTLDSFIVPAALGAHTLSATFHSQIPNLSIRNVISQQLGGRPPIDPAAPPARATLTRELTPLCATHPGLLVRRVLADDEFGPAVVLRPQGVLVAYATASRLRLYREDGQSFLGLLIQERLRSSQGPATESTESTSTSTAMTRLGRPGPSQLEYWTDPDWKESWPPQVAQMMRQSPAEFMAGMGMADLGRLAGWGTNVAQMMRQPSTEFMAGAGTVNFKEGGNNAVRWSAHWVR